MKFPFHKMHGCGNDFLIIDYLGAHAPEFFPSEVAFLCDRHFGLGADGLVVLYEASGAHAGWHFYNSDGSPAEMCGNAARCVIRYLADRHYPEEVPISLSTEIGIIRGKRLETENLIEITLSPQPVKNFQYEQKLVVAGENSFDVNFINTGVPHAVIEVKDLSTYPILDVGKRLLKHPAFGEAGTNVTFFQRVVGQKIRATTFERGVEHETFACGTGVAAAAIVYSETFLQPFPIQVETPGGTLEVDVSPVSNMLLLRGPAEYVYSVELDTIPRGFEKPFLFSDRK
jgi:diaminopimelate epimerase